MCVCARVRACFSKFYIWKLYETMAFQHKPCVLGDETTFLNYHATKSDAWLTQSDSISLPVTFRVLPTANALFHGFLGIILRLEGTVKEAFKPLCVEEPINQRTVLTPILPVDLPMGKKFMGGREGPHDSP